MATHSPSSSSRAPTLGNKVFDQNGGLDYSTVPGDLSLEEWRAYIAANTDIVRIYASDPAFYTAYPSGFYVTSTAAPCEPGDDGEMICPIQQHYISSAFITNPVTLTVNYQNTQGSALAPSTTLSGIAGTTPLTSYRLSNAPADYSTPAAPAMDLSVFFAQGATVSPEVLMLAGYIAPNGRTVTLNPGINTLTYIYLTQAEVDAGVTITPNGTPSVPNTGFQALMQSPLFVIAAGVLAVGVMVVLQRSQRNS